MNQTIKELYDRKSVRVFEDKKISEQDKNLILEAAVMAPTAGNQQLYTIIDVTDQELKEKLVKTCDDQPFIAEADLVLIFCADCKKWHDGFKSAGCEPRDPGVGDLLLAVSDANIAAQNAVTAAWSLGIGSCYIGDIMENCEAQRELLHLPKYVFPAAMLVFGYPTQQQKDREKPERAPMQHIVHENGYHDMGEEELRGLFEYKKAQNTYENYMKAFCNRKYNSDFSKEMSRSVGEYLKDFAKKE
jgi:nitroreductase